MTREEQIQKAASMHESACLWSDNSTSHKESFIRGAKWSDEHPFEEVIITDRRFILDKVCECLSQLTYQEYAGGPKLRKIEDWEIEKLKNHIEELL